MIAVHPMLSTWLSTPVLIESWHQAIIKIRRCKRSECLHVRLQVGSVVIKRKQIRSLTACDKDRKENGFITSRVANMHICTKHAPKM